MDRSTCYRDHASKQRLTNVRSDKSAYTILIGKPHLSSGPEKSDPMHVVRERRPMEFVSLLPSRKSLQVPWAHLARFDNRHTGAFIMNGSSVSILFSPPFVLLSRDRSSSLALAHLFLKLIREFGPERAIFAYINHSEGVGTGIVFSRRSCRPPSPLPFGDSPFILRNSIPIPECRIESH